MSMCQLQDLYIYRLSGNHDAASYDEAMAAACLQGLINLEAPLLYVLSAGNARPQEWLDTFSGEGEWLHGRKQARVESLDDLVRLAGNALKGAVIWDPDVPATLNVANTIAGVDQGVVLSPEFAEQYLAKWNLRVLRDLRGMFDGSATGSAKNDAYRWAIRHYLAPGLCSSRLLCLYEDPFLTRVSGNVGYVVTRDWAAKNKSFVFDLSPWGDEKPADDPGQQMGLDLETYRLILDEILRQSDGRHMTELAGFFSFSKYSNMPDHKSSHDPVPTEWETVYLISPYNCYQNTVAGDCYNQSLHSQAPFTRLRQRRPAKKQALENKVYLCIHMADYDSTTPLYDFLPRFWEDANRGSLPLAWGINPNLIDTYPDIIARLYRTATENDFFVADASAAGYFNPNRIQDRYWPMVLKHNQRYFGLTDMTIAPMVLDWEEPSAQTKDAFAQFSPDGYGTIIYDMHNNGGKPPVPHVWKGMPVIEMVNDACNFSTEEETAKIISTHIGNMSPDKPQFFLLRIVWVHPKTIVGILNALRSMDPELDVEAVDPYHFFNLLKEKLSEGKSM